MRGRTAEATHAVASTDSGGQDGQHGADRQFASPFASVVLRPLVFLITLVLVGLAVLGYFQTRPVIYEAGATLTVGRVDVPSNAVPGYAQAATTLAGSYSRFVGTGIHRDKMAELAGTSRGEVGASGGVSASNVPEAAIIRVTATSTVSAEQALRLADLGALALIEVVADVNDVETESLDLLSLHASASRSLVSTQAEVVRLQRDLAFFLNQPDGAAAAADTQEDLDNARAVAEQQQLQVNTFSALYIEGQRFRVDGPLLRTLSDAFPQGNSKSANLQLGVVAALVVGTIAAMGLTWLFANMRELRSARRAVVDRHRHLRLTSTNGPAPPRSPVPDGKKRQPVQDAELTRVAPGDG